MKAPILITSGRLSPARPSDTPSPTVAPPPAVEILKWQEMPAGVRVGLCDVAIPACGIILHDCAVFENTEDGTSRLSIGLPTKKASAGFLRTVSWIDKRSDLAQGTERAIIAALRAYLAAEGGAI